MYHGDTAELIRKSLTADYDNLKNILPELDPAVYRILDKALAVEINRRYHSCAQMQSDIDDLRRLIAETNVTLLGITMLASTLHLLFEFLTFKSDIDFWKGNKE